MWGWDGVREGGDDGVRKVGLTPGVCPRCSSSACVCMHLWVEAIHLPQ